MPMVEASLADMFVNIYEVFFLMSIVGGSIFVLMLYDIYREVECLDKWDGNT